MKSMTNIKQTCIIIKIILGGGIGAGFIGQSVTAAGRPRKKEARAVPLGRPINKQGHEAEGDTGDHVVVINSQHITLPGDEWRWRAYFHHTGYPGGATWTYAWELHEKDPTMIMNKAVYRSIERSLTRKNLMMRLHIFPESEMPEDIRANISNQIPVPKSLPRSLLTYSDEEIAKFPKIWDYPENYIIK